MAKTPLIRTYNKLILLPTFEERFEYVKCEGSVGYETLGPYRYLSQAFYSSKEWKRIRRDVIVRDNGCDLGVRGLEICGDITIHHLNPLSVEDFEKHSDFLTNPNYLISVSANTHKALHYGKEHDLLFLSTLERSPNDTCPWR